MVIQYAALTNKGNIRKENQDSLIIENRRINSDAYTDAGTASTAAPVCFAVFDGMGGGQCGRDASVLAADMLLDQAGRSSLTEIFHNINASIEAFVQANDLHSMGTTAAVLRFQDRAVEICNIGDSGIYCFYQDRMVRLSENHSIQIGNAGKRYLTQHLGLSSKEMRIEPFEQNIKLESGYRFLICSDGLTDPVPETEIFEITSEAPLRDVCQTLYARAMENGGNDNISIIIMDLKAEVDTHDR